ncbi:MptD family putative ECF transporter S component [Streptococcus caprae]|uniref:MptD family putative ECF transporter S component n=1 Tax=Streptococcus caprae TaxID=1640501 RepID=A0ABV8CXZ0_9STRE
MAKPLYFYWTTFKFTLFYYVSLALGTLLEVIFIRSGNMIMAPAFTGLVAGTAYMGLVEKTRRFGSITFVGIFIASFFFLSGHFVLAFVPNVLCGILADLFAKSGNYNDKTRNLLSYIVFSFGNLGPIILMWFAREAYIQQLLERGKDLGYVNKVMLDFKLANVSFLTVTILIGATLGGFLGQKVVSKYLLKSK